MGVSYYACKCCGESRYEEYVGNCVSCGKRIGTCCVVNDDIESEYAYRYGEIYNGSAEQKAEYDIGDDWEDKGWVTVGEVIDDTAIQPKYCPFCQSEKVAKEDVFDYLITKNGWDYEDLKREYLAHKKDGEAD